MTVKSKKKQKKTHTHTQKDKKKKKKKKVEHYLKIEEVLASWRNQSFERADALIYTDQINDP